MNTVATEKRRKASDSPPTTSFSSLPYDVTLNVLARIPRIQRPSLSLVSKSFRSLLASPELDVTRTLIGKTENYIYLYLETPRLNPKPCWYILASFPKQKLVPIPSFPYEHPKKPTIVSIGSEIYLIGGYVERKRSRNMFVLDCRSHQWRKLPEMQVPRGESAAGLIDGKIYAIGGCNIGENYGEIYDPKTQTWEPLSPSRFDRFNTLVRFWTNVYFVAEENILCTSLSYVGSVVWRDPEEYFRWTEVKGLERLPFSPDFISVANSGGGRRLTVWWRKEQVAKTEIWCGEISLERRSRENQGKTVQDLFGILEWSKILCTMDHSESGGLVSLLCSATVTH